MIDVSPRDANWFFFLAWFPGVAATMLVARRWMRRWGVVDRQGTWRAQLHWFGGSILSVAAVIALAMAVPSVRGVPIGQISVILFGMLWFTAGIHLDRTFLVLGPLFMAGGIAVGFVPHHGWTALGWLTALGLIVAGINASRGRFAQPPVVQ